MAKLPRSYTFLLIVGIVALGLAAPKWLAQKHQASKDPVARTQNEVVRARIEVLRPTTLQERLAATGTILPNEQVALAAEVAGKVEEIFFSEGRFVEAGKVLLRLDDDVARAEVDRARFRFELAIRREKRQQELLGQGMISQESYDAALSELNVLAAEVALREAQMEKLEIRAPFEGMVGLRDVSVGTLLSPQTRITTIQDVDPVKIEFAVPERYVGQVRTGQSIVFRVEGQEHDFEGTIYAVEPVVDAMSRSLTVRAKCANPDRRLVPGSFADVEVPIRELEGALSVPSIAVVPELGGKKVWVLEDGVARPRIVHTGIRTQQRVEVIEGLEAGEKVIVSSIQRLRTGLVIEAEEVPSAAGEVTP